MMDMRIVRADTYENIKEILQSCRNDFYNQSLNNDEMIDKLAQKFAMYGRVLVAQEGKQTAGFVAYYVNSATKTAYISMIILQKAYQGQGLGSLLLKSMLADCEQANQQKVRLEVADQNEKAIGFYKKWGFTWEGQASETSAYYSLTLRERNDGVCQSM